MRFQACTSNIGKIYPPTSPSPHVNIYESHGYHCTIVATTITKFEPSNPSDEDRSRANKEKKLEKDVMEISYSSEVR